MVGEAVSRMDDAPWADDDLAAQLLEAAPDAIVIVDSGGRIVLVNRQAELHFEYGRAELLGEAVELLLPADLREVHVRHRSDYAADPRVRTMGEGMELLARRRDGTSLPVEISLSPLDQGGRMLTIATVRDVTSRTQAEAEARRAQATLDAVHDAVLVFDTATLRITYANRGAVEQTGYPRPELLARTPVDLQAGGSEEELRELIAPLLAEEVASVTVQATHRRVDGTLIPVELVLQRSYASDGPPDSLVALARDVGERIAAENELQQVRAELVVTEDRERIGRDLHDTVIQHLFALGMQLQAVAPRVEPPDAAARVQATIDGLDDTIRELRTTIFDLQSGGEESGSGLARRIHRETADAARTLRWRPSVRTSGALDAVDEAVVEHLMPTLREALANVARHARAESAEVEVEVGDEVVLRVVDDGVGLGAAPELAGGQGLANMRRRAEELGGSCTVRPAAADTHSGAADREPGTIVEWRVPALGQHR